jgi:Flp pilus assembly pilin Flp
MFELDIYVVNQPERGWAYMVGKLNGTWGRWIARYSARARATCIQWFERCRICFKKTKGQGTTEYAILVGVLVVIAILAITVFRPKLQELWTAISDGINGL